MEYSPILAPVVALVAWSLIMLLWLAIARRRAFADSRSAPPSRRGYRAC